VNLRSQIAAFEGCRLKAYRCTQGVLTIGYGHTGPGVCEGLTWSQGEAEAALDADLQEAVDDCRHAFPWFDSLNEPRQAAIVGMVFQLGLGGVLKFRRMLDAMRDERYAEAETHALDSLWAKQTPRRARVVARQIATGEWEA
jgi:lysozyme